MSVQFLLRSPFKLVLLVIYLNLGLAAWSQNVAINTDGSSPDNSAMLDIKSISRGLLIPRMSTSERNAIPLPATGLMVYDTETNGFWFFNGTAWQEVGISGGGGGFWSLNGTHIYKTNPGNVGIGTINPLHPLTIQSLTDNFGIAHTDGAITLSTYIGGSTNGAWLGTTSNHSLSFFTNNGSAQLLLKPDFRTDLRGTRPWLQFFDLNSNSGSIRADGSDLEISAFKPGILITPPGNLLLQVDRSSPLGNEYAGLIGVGTTTPLYKFQVEADGFGIVQSNAGLRAGIYLGGGGGWLATQTLSPLYFCTGLLNGNNQAQMTLLPNGNFGIGTANPTFKLSVNGSILSKEIVVETGWADYVFDENYKLMPLKEVEAFIKTKKHLPGIEPASVIAEKGLAVAAMQTKMMEKIEELTIYIIELNKQLEIANREISELKAAARHQ